IRKIQRFGAAAAVFLVLCGCGIAWSVSTGRLSFSGGGTKKMESRMMVSENADLSEEADSAVSGQNLDQAVAEEEKLSYAKSYQEVRNVLQEIIKRQGTKDKDVLYENYDVDYESDGASTGADNSVTSQEKNTANVSKAKSASTSSTSHSKTNVSVEGIMEADQVITDGKYIYRLREKVDGSGVIDIVQVDGGTMELTGKYDCGEDYPREFFLAEDQLILLSYTSMAKVSRHQGGDTSITFVDISDRSKPVKTQELIQSGRYKEARLQDGYLYTVSGSSPYLERDVECLVEAPEEDYVAKGDKDEEDLVPCLNGKRILASQIYIPDGCNEKYFTTITSVKLDDPQDFTDARSIMSGMDTLHMTEENIYFTTDRWVDSVKKKGVLSKTQLTKFSYHNGKFTGKATKQIKGSIRDTFAINEYQGNLRVISSISYNTGKDDNAVYVLDEDLKIIGSIENLAKDERVYSARFQGDIGYFVTYRETDPLFSVDFSDPQNPKILGKLKIPGFSEYMHFYNDHLLFGLGVEEDKDGEREAVKLSMFDISDPTNVKEIHKTLLRKINYSEALHDYKSVMIDPGKNIIGFDGWHVYTDDLQYYVYSYDEEKGFVCKMHVKLDDDEFSARGLYIGNTVYLVSMTTKSIRAYDWNSGKCIGTYPKKKK
ncbi:MAG: beta-propeller domain-containing protein, partial [Lachnospiraceae bacterium]|nr:beta-propeller domain-containing protein [Lachnospiraceae bacterium]